MPTTTTVRFNDWYGQLYQLYQDKDYAKGLEIALTEGEQYFPHHAPLIYHYRACMDACLGNREAALATLQSAMDAGLWFNSAHWDDPDFDAIQDDAAFKALRVISDERFEAAKANARPILEPVTPETGSAPYPIVVGLHGNDSSLERMGHRWRSAAEAGWLVGLAQSSQLNLPDSYIWTNVETAEREIIDHVAALTGEHGADAGRLVLSGFSMGGETAIRMVLNGAVQARGFVAIAFGGPFTGEADQKQWEAVIAAAANPDARGYVVLGKADGGYDNQRKLVGRLRAAGYAIEVEEHDGMGHDFPEDFEARLPEMLAWVLND